MGETVCIYCKRDSSNSGSKEHIIPEALGCRDTLPRDWVCYSCNNYFSKMDKSSLLNRYIAIHVGAEEIPGKRDKIRRQIGEKMRFPKKGALEIDLGPVTITPNTRQADFHLEQSKEFDELLFARFIHKVAFNCYAFRFGHRNALHRRFDTLRRYVRRAYKDELWTYAVKESYRRENRCIAVLYETSWSLVELRLLSLDFLVSLTGWRREIESEIRNNNTYIIRNKGQWGASSILGLQR